MIYNHLQSFTRRFTTIHNYLKDDLQSFTTFTINYNHVQDHLQSFTTIHNQLQ